MADTVNLACTGGKTCRRAPRGDRPEAARPARALAAASDAAPRAARQGGALNKYGKSNHEARRAVTFAVGR